MVRTKGLKNYSDVHFTREDVAREIVDHFKPSGHVLEPFRGSGAFWHALRHPKSWCEISEDSDFFEWHICVDWIVSNPPFEDLTQIMEHAFKLADNVLFLVPMSKIYSSVPRLELVRQYGGIVEQYILGSGRSIGFNTGFPFAAMHFQRWYTGPTVTTWRNLPKCAYIESCEAPLR